MEKQYLTIYRKYRPATFQDMSGQEHVVRTLKNQIRHKTVSHAYIFTGSRGTGKTTAARIFAKAVNCLAPQDGSPCGTCEACQNLEKSNSLDVIEMDAASNNSVDDIRQVIESVKYPPVNVRYKVYIIDEAHMLSPSAFNALLKTLEEPPEYVIFILATTEVHKLPQTVASRCMRFDFELLSLPILKERLRYIFDDMKIAYEEDALEAIAISGEGSFRDTLSVAELCVSYCEDKITHQSVLRVLGAVTPEKLLMLSQAVIDNDTGAILQRVDEISSEGGNISRLAADFGYFVRDLIYLKNCGEKGVILRIPAFLREKALDIVKSVRNDKLIRILEIVNQSENALRYSSVPKTALECALLKAASLSADLSEEGLARRVKELELRFNALPAQNTAIHKPSAQQESVKNVVQQENIAISKDRAWALLLENVCKSMPKSIELALKNVRVEVKEKTIKLMCDTQFYKTMLSEKLQELNAISSRFGYGVTLADEKRKEEGNPNSQTIKELFDPDIAVIQKSKGGR